ncbi:MAG: SMR family transporter [bacterium]
MEFGFLTVSIILGFCGQILLKTGILRIGGVNFARGGAVRQLLSVLTSPHIVGGVSCFAASMIFYLAAISGIDISMAYPMVSVNFVLVVLFSRIFFREKVNALRWCGVSLIVAGVFLISRS